MKFRWINVFLISVASAAAVPCGATTLNSYLLNSEGVKKFGQKSYYPAYQDFMKALEDDPLNPEVHLNIARTLEANEEYAKAEQAYKGVLRILPKDSTRRFEALFNLAGVQAKQKKIPEALESYQAALALDPDSIEVKTNIELLWQQGGGEGEGGQPDPNQQQNNKGRGQDQQQPQQPDQQQKKQQPKSFSSQELSPQDVKKILDEIKNQEQNIRAQEYDKGAKEMPRDKDW